MEVKVLKECCLLPVRGLGVTASEQVPQGAWRRDLSISRVEDHADVLGNDGRLDAVVKLQGKVHSTRHDSSVYRTKHTETERMLTSR